MRRTAGLSWTVEAAAAGTATLGIRYANGTTAGRPADISVNGTVVAAASSFAQTGAWTTWVTKTVTAAVNAGTNTIRVAGTIASGPANLDFLALEVAGAATDYQAENRTISQGVVESNHAGFTGTGFVNGDAVAGSYVKCAVSASTAGSATLTYRFANGATSARPMSVTVNGVSSTPAFNSTGAWTAWAEVSITANLSAAARGIYAIVDWHMRDPRLVVDDPQLPQPDHPRDPRRGPRRRYPARHAWQWLSEHPVPCRQQPAPVRHRVRHADRLRRRGQQLRPGGPFAGTSRLKPAGQWVRDHLRYPADDF